MSRNVWVGDDPPADEPEEFCSDCLAGIESNEHHEKCVEPEEFEWVTNYAAHEFRNVRDVHRNYRDKGWATPISGDHTTIRKRFTR